MIGLRFVGFPEPWVEGSERGLRRSRKERIERFFREDVRDLEAVRDFSNIEEFGNEFPERVGSLLSINALREDLEVSHKTLPHRLDILDRMYLVFVVRPHAHPAERALKRMPKVYLRDISVVSNEAARFENLVASYLLKMCHTLEDRDGHEVDFIVVASGKAWFVVEAKLSEGEVSPALR